MTDTFSKTVAIKAVDEEERTATGAVLVPNEVDRQRDFLAPEGVERMFTPDPEDGVMHSAFPEGAADLVRSEVVDEEIELNGETYPAGTWVATRQYSDDALWRLVADGVLDGFSIGGEVEEVREYESAEDLPDEVSFPAEVEPGPATEIVDGSVEEVSDVDIPAVPRATYRELGKLGKSITDEVSGREEFVSVMEGRGHEPDDARRLWRYLERNEEKAAGTEKPIVLPNGAEFDDFGACVAEISGDGTSREEARAICGAGREQNKVDVNGVEVDLTPPESMVNAAAAALDAKDRLAGDIGDCGSGRGEKRARQIVDGTLAPVDFTSDENGTPIPAYLNSHADDAPDTDATPPNWSDETWTDGCGPVQYALWGGTGGGEPRAWAMRRANELARAMEDDAPYDEVKIMTAKAEYSTDEWVSWDASGGRARGQIVDVTEDGTYDDDISGDVTVEGTEDEPAYLIEVWRGTGDDASAIEEEAGRGDTLHVAHQESTLRRVDDPREVEASKSGIIDSLKSLFGSDDANRAEDPGGSADDDAEKAGRTLSQRNRRAVMASVDAQLDILNDAGVEHGMTRFSDRAEFAFDIEEYGKREHTPGEDDGEEMDKDAPGGDTPDTDMTDDNDDTEKSDAPAWAESLTEKVEQIDKRVSEMEDGDADAEKSLDDAPEWAQSLAEKVDGLDERVDKVSKATADPQQTGGTEKTGGNGEDLSTTERQKRELFFGGGN